MNGAEALIFFRNRTTVRGIKVSTIRAVVSETSGLFTLIRVRFRRSFAGPHWKEAFVAERRPPGVFHQENSSRGLPMAERVPGKYSYSLRYTLP